MKIILTGGTGMIGRALTQDMAADGHEVIILSRDPKRHQADLPPTARVVPWDGRTPSGWGALAAGADAIVNLAGARIAGPNPIIYRWSNRRKRLLCDSRKQAGLAVTEAVRGVENKPGLVVQFSGADYYPSDETHATESTPAGHDFLSHICQDCWEPSTAGVETLGVRRVVARMGPVLSVDSHVLRPLVLQHMLFVGGPLGRGEQGFSWIHISDVVRAVRFFIETPSTAGVFNLTAPKPDTNRSFSRALADILRRPSALPVPAFALRLVLGEMADTLLKGPRVYPQRLLDLGFEFQYPDAHAALKAILR